MEIENADVPLHDCYPLHDINHATPYVASQPTLTLDDFSPTAEPSIFTLDENPWDGQTILSIDGGGVRGFTSLLLLQELMKKVGILERAVDPNALSSAYSPWLDSTPSDEKQLGYKPCHYFDYIGGSSTGGLSAIMLGRLRMTIEASMRHYSFLSAEVFQRLPSRLKRPLRIHSSDGQRESLRKIFASLMPEQPSPDEVRNEFRSDPLRCKTIVCSVKSSRTGDRREPTLFRSYDHWKTSRSPDERNSGSAFNFDIQTVASATSGASSCLKSFEVRKPSYYDDLNNPSWEVYNEVKLLTRGTEHSINLLLSIGGGNSRRNHFKDVRNDKSLQRDPNFNSEHIDKKLKDENERQNFHYYRLNVDQGLQDVAVDEWKPKKTGETTLRRIVSAFKEYLQTDKAQGKINECAQELVRVRTLRAKTTRWETFATGVRYFCPIPNCGPERTWFGARNELLDHLQKEHGKPPPDIEHYQEIQGLLNAGKSNIA